MWQSAIDGYIAFVAKAGSRAHVLHAKVLSSVVASAVPRVRKGPLPQTDLV